MAEHVGLVLETHDDKTAEVATDRRDFCSGCRDTSKCRMCLKGSRHVETIRNAIGAHPGDVVSICLEDGFLWAGSVSLLIIPVLWMLTGAMIGAGLGAYWEIGETGGAALLGLSGFAVGLVMIVVVSRSFKSILKATPRIVRVIERSPKVVQEIGLFGRGFREQL